MSTLVRTPDEITAAWLSAALGDGALEIASVERIGTGQMSQNHRVAYRTEDGGEHTVVVKLASDDATSRAYRA